MIKSSSIRRICIATLILFILGIIYLFPKNKEIEETIEYISKEQIPIYLVDENSYVARTTIIKNTTELVPYIISTLTIDSTESNYIRDGFSPIIPKNTELLDYTLEDNILTLNFSKEFFNVSKNNEEIMIEAIIYSLTEVIEIDKIQILVEGERLTHLPNSKKILPEYLDKTYGINKEYGFTSIKDTSKTTIYYLSKKDDYYYYVPITKISNDITERVEVIIQELKSTPALQSNLISYLSASSNISNYELLESSITLSFDNYLISNLDDEDILESVRYSIALSLRDTYGVANIILDDAEVLNLNYSFSD